jgi:hypothetical protein
VTIATRTGRCPDDDGDDAAERAPRVGVHAKAAAKSVRFVAVDEVEGERELVPQFVLPLLAERCGSEHEHALHAAAQHQFREDQTRFDGLAEPHDVGDQQADARHPQRFEEGHKLEVIYAATGHPCSRC